MAMKVEYEGTTYQFDMEEVTTDQLITIEKVYGLNLLALGNAMREGAIQGLLCVWWLMQLQNTSNDLLRLQSVKLDKPVKFSSAVLAALIVEMQELVESAEKAAKDAQAEGKGKPGPKA